MPSREMTSEEQVSYDCGYSQGYSDAQAKYQRYIEIIELQNREMDEEIKGLKVELRNANNGY